MKRAASTCGWSGRWRGGWRGWLLGVLALMSVAGAAEVSRAAEADTRVAQLPLIERPATRPTSAALAIFLTGDGGWAAIDRGITATLNERGVSVVGLNAREYLSTARTPDEVGRDVEAIAAHYGRAWGKAELILIGFSRGADLAPFAVGRFSPAMRGRVKLVALLGLGRIADFEFRLLNFLRPESPATSRPVAPELEKLRGLNVLSVHGDGDDDALGAELDRTIGRTVTLVGDHHLGRDYPRIGQLIFDAYEHGTPKTNEPRAR